MSKPAKASKPMTVANSGHRSKYSDYSKAKSSQRLSPASAAKIRAKADRMLGK